MGLLEKTQVKHTQEKEEVYEQRHNVSRNSAVFISVYKLFVVIN